MMMTRPNVIITHGLGKHPEDFHLKLKRRLLKRVDANIVPFYYHDIFQPFQERNFKKYEYLGFTKIRRFVFENVADGVVYKEGYAHPTIYEKIHWRLNVLIDSLPPGPLVIIAPSLGGKVMMDHIWDSQRDHLEGRLRMNKLKLFITNGCNLPLFVGGLANIQHIDQKFKWLNFFDHYDVLGFPLEPMGYRAEDIRVSTYGLLASHLLYWRNKKFLNRVADEIGKL